MAGVDAPYFGVPPLSEDRLKSKGIFFCNYKSIFYKFR